MALEALEAILEIPREADEVSVRIPMLLVRAELASRMGYIALAEKSLLQIARLTLNGSWPRS